MRAGIKVFILFSLVFIIASCASTPEWKYAEDAITLHLKSGPDLNLYQGKSHTLLLCIYQLKDPNMFNQLSEEKEGLAKLLQCGRFDASATTSKRLIIHPDQKITETLDRAEGAKYIGIVAGYFKHKERITRLFPIPVSRLTKKPKKFKVNLYLGPQEIQEAEED
jgi:type VI secretion system VasD/TssJ family lipoprotein